MTIIDHYLAVNDLQLKNKLINNIDYHYKDKEVDTLSDAILNGFDWENSPEGDDYWDNIHKQSTINDL